MNTPGGKVNAFVGRSVKMARCEIVGMGVEVSGTLKVARRLGAGTGVMLGRAVLVGLAGAAVATPVIGPSGLIDRPGSGPQPPMSERTTNPAKQIFMDFIVFSLPCAA